MFNLNKVQNNLDEFYKNKLQEGYKLSEIDNLTLKDVDRLVEIFKEKEQFIDEVFPFLF